MCLKETEEGKKRRILREERTILSLVIGKRRKSLELTINLRTIIDWEAEQIDSCAAILDFEREARAFCAQFDSFACSRLPVRLLPNSDRS